MSEMAFFGNPPRSLFINERAIGGRSQEKLSIECHAAATSTLLAFFKWDHNGGAGFSALCLLSPSGGQYPSGKFRRLLTLPGPARTRPRASSLALAGARARKGKSTSS